MFKVYDKVWILGHNGPRQMLVFAVVDSMNYWKTGTERYYHLVDSRIGAGWGNDEGMRISADKAFKDKAELLATL